MADAGNFTIRRITPAGMVSTIAGVAGSYGFIPGAPPGVISPVSLTLSGGALYMLSNSGIVRLGAPAIETRTVLIACSVC